METNKDTEDYRETIHNITNEISKNLMEFFMAELKLNEAGLPNSIKLNIMIHSMAKAYMTTIFNASEHTDMTPLELLHDVHEKVLIGNVKNIMEREEIYEKNDA